MLAIVIIGGIVYVCMYVYVCVWLYICIIKEMTLQISSEEIMKSLIEFVFWSLIFLFILKLVIYTFRVLVLASASSTICVTLAFVLLFKMVNY